MNNKIHITSEEMDMIDGYLNDNLSATELEAFEKRQATEAGWKEKVEEVRLLSLGIQEAALEQMLQKFRSQKEMAPIIPLKKTTWKKWLIAASVIAITMIGWLVVFNKPGNEKLFATYYTQDPGLPVVMGGGNTNDYTLYDGMIDYKEGNYTKAIEKWKSIGDNHAYADTLNYYIGIANMNAGNMNEAVRYLQPLSEKQGAVYHQKSMWYVALVYIRQGNTIAARNLLIKITDKAEAKELLNRISE